MIMVTDHLQKATTEEIRARFDKDVERFSNLETGQQTTIDAPLTMELCTEAAKYVNADAKELLDIGCGAGNYTLKMLTKIGNLNCTLVDLSLPMLEKAKERVSAETNGKVTVIQSDMRDLHFPDNHFDVILAAAVFHHLRGDEDWESMFTKIYKMLKPGGSIWISDLISHDHPAITQLFQAKYGEYIESLGGKEYREKVETYVAYEDSPRSVMYQLDLMKKVGFRSVEILHKNSSFAAFGGIK
jgi:tRNA (cmo5U34)-methyltransferase